MSTTFARRSSGLVKEVTLSDLSMWGLYYALVLFFNLFIFPVYMLELPGASVPIAIVIAFAIAIPIYVIYGSLGSILPRSGGDYLFESRGIHPVVGLIITFGWVLFALGWEAFSSTPYLSLNGDALGPYSLVVGSELRNTSLVNIGNFLSSVTGIVTLGVILLILAFILYLAGMRWIAKIQRYVLLPALAITAVTIPVIYLTSGSSTVANFNAVAKTISGNSDTYHLNLNGAVANRYTTPSFDWGSTIIMATILASTSIGASTFGNPLLGEVKGAGHFKKLTSTYLVAGLVTAFGFLFPEIFLFTNNYGWDFTHAASYAALVGVKGTSPNVPLTYGFLTLSASSNVVLQTLFVLGYIAVGFLFPLILCMAVARYNIGASIDGTLPLWFSSISQRLKKPINAMILPLILTIVGLYLEASSVTGFLLLIALGTWITFVVETGTGLSAVLFPFRQKFLVKASPVAKYPWIMQVAGGIVVIVTLLEAYWYYTVPSLALSLGLPGYGLLIGTAVGSAALFFAMQAYKKRQGIDIMLAFKEVPPE
jgi:amino acid transporter